jgi:very-short-patch-repair endonuclease
VLDFYCHEARLCVEVDGGSHSLGDHAQRDERRDGWLAEKGIRTLRISASCILDDVDDAVRMIVAAANDDDLSSEWKPPPSPLATPPPKGEELG